MDELDHGLRELHRSIEAEIRDCRNIPGYDPNGDYERCMRKILKHLIRLDEDIRCLREEAA